MKKLVACAALALAACSGADEAAEPAAEETAVVEEAAATAVDGGPVAGTYEVTGPNGEMNTVVLSADGTAVYTAADGTVTNGTYTGGTATEPYCVTMEGETEADCFAEAITDGVWTATNQADPEDVWTVVRAEGG